MGCFKDNREFYTATYRTSFVVPAEWKGRRVWMRPEGINYRSEILVNGELASVTAGMFQRNAVDVTGLVRFVEQNSLVVKVRPVDFPYVRTTLNDDLSESGVNMVRLWAGGFTKTLLRKSFTPFAHRAAGSLEEISLGKRL